MNKVLIIEKDQYYREYLTTLLEKNYIDHDILTTIVNISNHELSKYRLIIFDMFEDKETREVLFDKKDNEYTQRLVVLTHKANTSNEIEALKNGVSDFIYKKTHSQVIIERLKKSLKEAYNVNNIIIESKPENIIVNLLERTVYKNHVKIDLTKKEYQLILLFLKNKNEIITRDYIYEQIWSNNQSKQVDIRIIDSHIRNLRNKMRLKSIMSIRGHGYKWVEFN